MGSLGTKEMGENLLKLASLLWNHVMLEPYVGTEKKTNLSSAKYYL